MKRAALIALMGAIGAPAASSGPSNESAPATPESAPIPVLVELFTSEGCSSCPPADVLLSQLVQEQPLAGIRVIGLGEHVDYWNDLGWPDRFSSPAFTRRQSVYAARVFTRSAVYTPQIVVDGAYQAVGSNAAAVRQAVRDAARREKADVQVSTDLTADGQAEIALRIEIPDGVTPDGDVDVMVAVTEDDLETAVERGENGGRTLAHDAVVHRLVVVDTIGSQRRSRLTTTIPIDDEWPAHNLRITAFVQERESRRVLGAASARLGAAPRPELSSNQGGEEQR